MANLTLDPIEVEPNVSLDEPDVEQLTTSSITGTGVFDKLMAVVKLHLLDEYNNDRITGDEYSKVYLGALSAVMQQSIAFLDSHQNGQRIRAEIGLVRQKTVTELAQTDDTILLNLGFNGTTAVEGVVADQKALVTQQLALATAQTTTATAEKDLLGQKIITELVQTGDSLVTAKAAGYGYNGNDNLGGFAEYKKQQQEMDVALTEQKIVTELSNTSDSKPATLGQMNSVTVIEGLAYPQREKILSEKNLLDQKKATELAQIQDLTVSAAIVAGVIGKQKALFQAQTDGFTRDAEQKAAKLMVDAWSVSATMGVGTVKSANRLDDPNLGAMLDVLLAGANVTPIP
jgi:hypothetical protein